MAEKYYAIITELGQKLAATAIASQANITLTHSVVGDGGGKEQIPDPARTALVNEKYRGAISALKVSPDQPEQVMATLLLPAETGGYTIREIGLLTESGHLFALANCAAIEKPVGGVSITVQFRIAISDTSLITLKVATGDGMFLRIDQNLADAGSVEKVRENLHLKGAALLDVGTTKDTVAAGDDERIVNALDRRKGGDVEGNVLIKQLLSLGTKGNGVFDGSAPGINIGDSDSGFLSASDGRLDVYCNNAHIGWLNASGLHISGLDISGPYLLLTGNDRKHIRFADADNRTRMFIWKDKGGDGVHINNGDDGGGDFVCHKNGEFYAPNNLYAGGAKVQTDGNIDGGCWGGYLSNWIVARANEAHNNANNKVSGFRLAGFGTATNGNNDNLFANAPDGSVVVGVQQKTNYTAVNFRYPQICINGGWYNVGVA